MGIAPPDMYPLKPDPFLVNRMPFREFSRLVGKRLPGATVLRLYRIGRRKSHDDMVCALRRELKKAR